MEEAQLSARVKKLIRDVERGGVMRDILQEAGEKERGGIEGKEQYTSPIQIIDYPPPLDVPSSAPL